MPLHHLSLTVSSLPTSRSFYLTLLAPLNYIQKYDITEPHGTHRLGFGLPNGCADFWLVQATDDKDVNRNVHVAFTAESREEVEAFWKAGLEAGGKDNGKPGPRAYTKDYYGGFVLDPDGNNVEAAMAHHD